MKPPEIDDLVSEAQARETVDLDLLSTQDLVELINREDAGVADAVARSAAPIADAIDAVVERLAEGGRLVYVGAGTSGRLAALDAAECETTFSTPPGQIVALVAGGATAPGPVQDTAEDDAEAGRADIEALALRSSDVVIGVSASGRTPYVLAALEAAGSTGVLTIALVCNPDTELAALAERELAVVVGPEVLVDSTRLKAGTAQKLVLNTISTIAMVRLGKTFGNLMVAVRPSNLKLRERQRRIVAAATGATPSEVEETLAAAEGDAKVAIVALLAGVGPTTARERLEASDGHVRKALRR